MFDNLKKPKCSWCKKETLSLMTARDDFGKMKLVCKDCYDKR